MRNLPITVLAVVMMVLVALLYGPFIDSPIIFDDIYFFIDPKKYIDLSLSGPFARRWVATATLALSYRFWGTGYAAYHVGNLALHFLTVLSLFLFLRDLLTHQRGLKETLPAFGAAMLFALHPVVAFAVGYIAERSIILASLFSVWMWIAVHRGVAGEKKSWLLLSVVFYYLAVFSKEHAITAIPVAMLLAWNAAGGNLRKTASALVLPLPLWILIAVIVALRMKGVIGSAYEPLLGEMLQDESPHTFDYYLRSVVNQGWLFFKYAFLWLVPNESWMSIDMREPFPPTAHAVPWIFGMLAFLAYPWVTFVAFRRGYLSQLASVALLSPWLLFLTMFSVVQYQESFVLYRSYLWALPATALVALLLAKLPQRGQIAALAVGGLLCFGSTWSRLQTFSHPVLLWDEAIERLNGRDDLPGTYRVYFNRGVAYANIGDQQRALADFDRTIALNPASPYAYGDRGIVQFKLGAYQEALDNLNQAIALKPAYPRFYVNRGMTLIKMGRRNEGLADLADSCRLGFACKRYEDEVAKGANGDRAETGDIRPMLGNQ